jgi:hypothetical protein
MVDRILGFEAPSFYGLILLLLLIILGIVSFQYYAFVNTNNGLRFGTGFGAGILTNQQRTGAQQDPLLQQQLQQQQMLQQQMMMQ